MNGTLASSTIDIRPITFGLTRARCHRGQVILRIELVSSGLRTKFSH